MRIFKRKLKERDLRSHEFKLDKVVLPNNNNIANIRLKVIKYHVNFQNSGLCMSFREDLYDYIECEVCSVICGNKIKEGEIVLISAYCLRMLFKDKILNINKGDIIGLNYKHL